MVNLQVIVQDFSGNRLVGIPVNVKVWNNTSNPFAANGYSLTPTSTDANGSAEWGQVQGYAKFNASADGSPDYGSGSCSASTTDTSGGFCVITLPQVTKYSSNGSCPSGYISTNGQCIQTSKVGTSAGIQSLEDFFGKNWWVFAVVIILIVVIAGMFLLRKFAPKLPNIKVG